MASTYTILHDNSATVQMNGDKTIKAYIKMVIGTEFESSGWALLDYMFGSEVATALVMEGKEMTEEKLTSLNKARSWLYG